MKKEFRVLPLELRRLFWSNVYNGSPDKIALAITCNDEPTLDQLTRFSIGNKKMRDLKKQLEIEAVERLLTLN